MALCLPNPPPPKAKTFNGVYFCCLEFPAHPKSSSEDDYLQYMAVASSQAGQALARPLFVQL